MPASPPTDEDDVRQALRGDREAFGRLFDRHAPGVRAAAAAVGGLDAVDDVTQEAFLRAYRRLSTLRVPSSFGAWVRGVARQVARERRRHSDAAAPLTENHAGEPPIENDPHTAAAAREEQSQLLAALERLPERDRLAVHAYYFSQQQADAAAAELGLSRSGYYAVLQRALKQLRAALTRDHATRRQGAEDETH